MKSVRFVTFGCKANQYDTQVLREALLRRGLAEQKQDCDLMVVNTCTVTAEAGRKARQLIRRVNREQPDTQICVTGCLAENEPQILRELPGVQWVLGNGDAKRPINFLRELGHEISPEELGIPAGITQFQGHTRAFLKIQDGCDQACSFCIIPGVRGKSRSRESSELQAEIERLVRAGHVEIVLCGIHIGHWGRDLGLHLADLLQDLVDLSISDEAGAPLDFRVRLSSIEATEVCERTLDLMAGSPDRIAPHLHMPLQSGSGEILRAMNRWYDPEMYLRACERVRGRLDRPALSADVLVGFPGETEEHFQETLETSRLAGFCSMHIFPFSARAGTPAAAMGGTVAPEDVRHRRMRLSEWASQSADRYTQSLHGVEETVVMEGFSGLSGRYQRVHVDPALIEGPPPPCLNVRLVVARQKTADSTPEQPSYKIVLQGTPLAQETRS